MKDLRDFNKNFDFYISKKLDKPVAKPHWIYVSLSHKCNLSCKMCVVKKLLPGIELEKDIVDKMFSEVASWQSDPTVVLTGGEPFLRNDIFEIISDAVSKGINIEAVSNGTLIDKKLAHLIAGSGLSNIAISLDGASAETHDLIRGKDGTHERALKALENLKEAKSYMGSGIQISAWITIMSDNIKELSGIAFEADRAGAECIVYHPLIVEQADMMMTKKSGDSWIRNADIDILRRELRLLQDFKNKKGKIVFLHEPHLFIKYFEGSLSVSDWTCNPFVFINIGPNGVVSCCGEPSYGDLHFQSLHECLSSDSARKVRKRMKACSTPCLQTCWARPEADRLEDIVVKFINEIDKSSSINNAQKRRAFEEVVSRLSEYESELIKKDN